ncbi:hypothetical protein HK101_007081 [Irineochytrium annulatum]|nr:hypothetical protein HK101_007081 [Irineochytrium annulatum]
MAAPRDPASPIADAFTAPVTVAVVTEVPYPSPPVPACNGANPDPISPQTPHFLVSADTALHVHDTLSDLQTPSTAIRPSSPGFSDDEYPGGVAKRRPSVDNASLRSSRTAASSQLSHDEPHFAGAEIVRDVIIGLSDGLTVPFALAAGLSALQSSRLVVTAGMAEIVAGAISMGLGGYLAGRSEIEHYDAERRRERHEVDTMPKKEEAEIVELFEPYGLAKKDVEPLIRRLKSNPELWVDFMMKFELSLERPDGRRSYISALTIGISYFLGGLVPLVPYMCTDVTMHAFFISIATTLLVLLLFGYVKAKLLGVSRPILSAFQMMLIGAAAAGVAYGVAKAIQ